MQLFFYIIFFSSLISCDVSFFSASYFSYDDTFKNSGRNTTLVSITENLIDIVWEDMEGSKPTYPGDDLMILNETYTGRSWEEKIFDASSPYDTIRELMATKEADALVVHKLDEIACELVFLFFNFS